MGGGEGCDVGEVKGVPEGGREGGAIGSIEGVSEGARVGCTVYLH